MKNKFSKSSAKWYIITIVLLLGLGGLYLGKKSHSNVNTASTTGTTMVNTNVEETTGRNLHIYVTVDESAGLTSVPLGDASGNHKKITYLGVSNALLDIDGTSIKLEDAIQEGHVTIDQILSQARMDAKIGYCEEIAESSNGLTKFTYRYPEFDLLYIYDLYETPDGKQHLISEFGICECKRTPSFLYMDDETGKPIDYEDWGLSFEISGICSTGVTLKCKQSGGQHIGDLNARFYNLYKQDADTGAEEFMEPLVDEFLGESNLNVLIEKEGLTEISVDFSHLHGELPAGDYVVYLAIVDEYNEDEVHSLMRNYRDEQVFGIAFTIA